MKDYDIKNLSDDNTKFNFTKLITNIHFLKNNDEVSKTMLSLNRKII